MRATTAMEPMPGMRAPEEHATDGFAETAEDGAHDPAGSRRDHLQMLVCELLEENQRLRTRLAQLKQRAESAERGLASAARWAGALF